MIKIRTFIKQSVNRNGINCVFYGRVVSIKCVDSKKIVGGFLEPSKTYEIEYEPDMSNIDDCLDYLISLKKKICS